MKITPVMNMLIRMKFFATYIIVSFLSLFLACNDANQETQSNVPSSVSNVSADKNEIAAVVGRDTIYLEEVDEIIKKDLYELRKEALFTEVTTSILEAEASKLGLTLNQLIQTRIVSTMSPISDEDIRAYIVQGYGVSKKYGPSSDLYQKSKRHLEDQEYKKRETQYVQGLMIGRKDIKISLRNPESEIPVDFRNVVSYARGNPNSPIKLFTISDYRCANCKNKNDEMQRIYRDYGHAVEFYSLLYTNQVSNAERASMAAGRQGKFWEMHNLIFANQRDLNDQVFFDFAKQLNLDMDEFRKDLSSPEIQRIIDDNIAILRKNDIYAVPITVLNGKKIPKDYSVDHIESILQRIISGE